MKINDKLYTVCQKITGKMHFIQRRSGGGHLNLGYIGGFRGNFKQNGALENPYFGAHSFKILRILLKI